MNYIGSKHSLLAEIRGVLAAHGLDRAGGTFLDAFAGTAVVGQLAKAMGFSTVSNDLQHYSYVLQQCFLVQDGPPAFAGLHGEIRVPDALVADYERRARRFGLLRDRDLAGMGPLVRVLAWLDALPGRAAGFCDAYCEGGSAGRNYFSADNGARCEAIRDLIAAWEGAGLVTTGESCVLLSSLLESADQVANTASVYAAFLKHVKKSARAPLALRIPAIGRAAPGTRHEAHCADIARLVSGFRGRRFDVLYLDPPYNQRQYNAYYHILETLARWDLGSFTPRGKTGLRPDEQNSRFCRRPAAAAALASILDGVAADHVLVSYSNEGLIPEDVLREELARRAVAVDFREVAYKRFRADSDSAVRSYSGDEVREFLFFARLAPEPQRVPTRAG
ncbi:MAG: DNA adenine methylase [Candidatus Sericytochromatia bacterium]|nr:DNA adenine methylase [Candidatus Tanganyikabacteria bacterium]